TAREQLRRTLYAAHLNLAQAAWEGDRVGDVLKLLNREKAASPDLCGFEWHYWMRQCHADLRTLKLPPLSPPWTACSADGSRISSLSPFSGDPTTPPTTNFKVWDTASGKEVASFSLPTFRSLGGTALSADGTRLAIGLGPRWVGEKSAFGLVIVDATNGQRLAAVSDRAGEFWTPAFSSDGKQVAAVVVPDDQPHADTSIGELNIWDATTGRQLRAIPNITGFRPRPAFSPDGARIAVVSRKPGNQLESEVKLWDGASGNPLPSLPAAIGGPWASVTFSPDGQALAAVGRASLAGKALHVWDIASGRQRFTIHGPFRDDFVNVAFSPDSR